MHTDVQVLTDIYTYMYAQLLVLFGIHGGPVRVRVYERVCVCLCNRARERESAGFFRVYIVWIYMHTRMWRCQSFSTHKCILLLYKHIYVCLHFS